MATTPTNTPDKKPTRQETEEEVFMREVDEGVRKDELSNFGKKYGWPLGIALVLGLAAFAGYLFWSNSSEETLEVSSENLIIALDELEKGDPTQADEKLALIASEGSDGAASMAIMLRAGIAAEQGRKDDSIALFAQIADDGDVPQALRDLASVRMMALQFDDVDPQVVIDRLGPIATADNALFGSAGELVAFAYLAQDKPDQAGPLLAQITKDENVPESLRSRTRDLAGSLGVDTIEDVEETLNELRGDAPQQGAPAQQ